jgi:transposase-like protein
VVQRFTPLLIEAARPCRHSVGDRWFVDETYVRVAGVWRYVYRAVDQYGQVIDIYVSKRRNVAAATGFFETMLAGRDRPREVTTDLAAPLLRVVDDLLSDALLDTTQYANNRIEWDHGLRRTHHSNLTRRPDSSQPSRAHRSINATVPTEAPTRSSLSERCAFTATA